MPKKATRRGHNSGAVYYSASHKRWEGYVSLGFVDGKRKRITRTGKTEREVVEKLDALKLQMHLGTFRADKSPRLSDYLEGWLKASSESRWRPKTRQAYESAIGRIVPALGHFRLDQLHNSHVETLLNAMAGSHSRNTIANTRGVLRAALNDAIRDDLITRNPAKEARMPRHVVKETTEPNPLSQAELVAFLDSLDTNPFGDLFTVALMTGLRIGEMRGLRWRDVDLPRSSMRVTNQLQNIDGKDMLTQPKSRNARRTIPLPDEAVTALRRQRRSQLTDRALAGERWQDGDFVFTSTVGTPVDDSKVRKALARAFDDAGIKRRRFHDLRHSCGTFLASTGVQPKELQRILGHESFETTMQLYVHSYTTSVEAAMQAWSKLRKAS